MTRWIIRIGVVVVSLSPPNPAAAGPWTLVEGEVVASVAHIGSEFDRFFDDNGDEALLPGRVRQNDTLFTVAYGVIDDWDVSVQLSRFQSEQLFAPGDAQSGLGDSRVSAKHLFHRGAVDLAAQVGVKLAGAYDPDQVDAPGDGQTDFEARILGGKLWTRTFVDLELAYRIRSGTPSDEFEILFDSGYAFTPWLHGRGFSRFVNARSGGAIGVVPLKETEEDILSVGGSLSVSPLSGLLVTMQYTTAVTGRNTPMRSDVGVGFAYSFDFFLD